MTGTLTIAYLGSGDQLQGREYAVVLVMAVGGGGRRRQRRHPKNRLRVNRERGIREKTAGTELKACIRRIGSEA